MRIKYTGEGAITIASYPWTAGDEHEIDDELAGRMVERADFEEVKPAADDDDSPVASMPATRRGGVLDEDAPVTAKKTTPTPSDASEQEGSS